MKPSERDTLKKQIRSRIEKLETLIAVEEQDSETPDAREDDEASKLDRKISSTVNSQVIKLQKSELDLLKVNLDWLDTDLAGCCEICGEAIPTARLRAVPITRMCIQCAEFENGR